MERLIIVLTFLSLSSLTFGQKPILPLAYSSAKIPFLDEALRDPMITKIKRIRDFTSLEETLEDLESSREELHYAKGLRRLELLENQYLSYQEVVYFLTDVKHGRIGNISNFKGINSKIAHAKKMANTYAKLTANQHKDKRRKGRALYHFLTNQYLDTNKKTVSVKSLLKVRPHLNNYLKRRVDFLNGMHQAEYKNEAKGIKILQKMMKSMTTRGTIAGQLVVAKKLAGIKRNGTKSKKSRSSYRQYLAGAAYRSQSLPTEDQKKVFSALVGIWRGAEGSRSSWKNVPFKLSNFSKITEVDGIYERIAIDDIKSKSFKNAISKYYRLSNRVSLTKHLESIDLRIIGLNETLYAKHKTGIAMNKVFEGYQKKYANNQRSIVYRTVRKKHIDLIDKHLNKALSKSSSKGIRNASISIGDRYLNGLATSLEEIRIQTKIAKIFLLSGKHDRAVDRYTILKDKTSGKQSLKFLDLAIKSQRYLANWPGTSPWNRIPKGDDFSRSKLITMTAEKYQLTNNWYDMAHLGLLLISQNQMTKAFSLWEKKIKLNSDSIEARRALGYMAIAYKQQKQWRKLEGIARLGLKKSISPLYKNRSYSNNQFLADALFLAGKSTFSDGNWSLAVAKLKEFSSNYPKDRRRPESLYILGQAHYNNAEYSSAIATLETLVNAYPRSKFEKQSLLLGGQWSIPMALEDHTIFFYQNFVNRYSRDAKTIEIRKVLAELYLGRGIYGSATRIYLSQANDFRLSAAEKTQAALSIMDIEERYGDIDLARRGAQLAERFGNDSADALSKVYGFMARQAALNNQSESLRPLIAKLERLPNDSPIVRENLAQAKLSLALEYAKRTKVEIFNLGVKDPLKVLKEQFAIFKGVKRSLIEICNIGSNSYCAPAMMVLSQTTKNTFETIEGLTIPQELDETTVENFESTKLEIMAYLDQTANDADSQAIAIMSRGEVRADWAQEGRINYDSDSLLGEGTATLNEGYIQWTPVTDGDSAPATSREDDIDDMFGGQE